MKVSTILASMLAVASPAAATQIPDQNKPGIDDPVLISRFMDAHWYWRRIHCAQDLTWDPKLAQAAMDSVSACTAEPQHDRGGSNLSSAKPAPGSRQDWLEFARGVVHGWHEEEPQYPYNDPHYNSSWGHFSQLVWRDTSRLGCAIGHCPDDHDWPARVYCFYENAGNNIVEGAFKENVWPMVCPDPTTTRTGKEVPS